MSKNIDVHEIGCIGYYLCIDESTRNESREYCPLLELAYYDVPFHALLHIV